MLHGDEHKRRRAVLHKHMAKGSVEKYLPQMCAEIRAVGAKLARLGSFDPHRFTATLALRTICIAVFGAQVISSGDEEALVQAVGIIEDDLADEMFRVLPLGPLLLVSPQQEPGLRQACDVDRGAAPAQQRRVDQCAQGP